jgi:tetratricopeptide (TPR) repeat protein
LNSSYFFFVFQHLPFSLVVVFKFLFSFLLLLLLLVYSRIRNENTFDFPSPLRFRITDFLSITSQLPNSLYPTSKSSFLELTQAEQQKIDGNKKFQQSEWQLSYDIYKSISPNLSYLIAPCLCSYSRATTLSTTLLLNQSACELKLNRPTDALATCKRVLQSNPNHIKALYRSGLAHFDLGQYDEAKKCFEIALEITPNDKAIISAMKKTICKEKEENEKEKKLFANMFM